MCTISVVRQPCSGENNVKTGFDDALQDTLVSEVRGGSGLKLQW